MYESHYRDLESGVWAEANPYTCPCRSGWLLSDFDTWQRCPIHGKSVPHPEDEDGSFDHGAHRLQLARTAYAQFRAEARQAGFRGSFKAACRAASGRYRPSIKEWVCAAEQVASEYRQEVAEQAARRAGYSCGLERRWSEDAEFERSEARG
jgi:hypothetical protein